tara:strand:- start:1781 stop:2356 length:576 start_codon:yes stop_codon:yes gene_type:complete
MGKIKIRKGNMSIEVDETSRSIFTEVLKAIPDDTRNILESTTETIYKDAYDRWPVRKEVSTATLTDVGKVRFNSRHVSKTDDRYTFKRALAMSYKLQKRGELRPPEFRKTSQDSKGKLYTGFVFSPTTLEAVVGNSAPYAWAIKVGLDTDLPYALGTRVSNELLWKPAKRKADAVAEELADALLDETKQVK